MQWHMTAVCRDKIKTKLYLQIHYIRTQNSRHHKTAAAAVIYCAATVPAEEFCSHGSSCFAAMNRAASKRKLNLIDNRSLEECGEYIRLVSTNK